MSVKLLKKKDSQIDHSHRSYSLADLPSERLIERLRVLSSRERKIQIQVIRYLSEVEKRKTYLRMGHASLFMFCTKELKYSSGSAYRRISAMRLSQQVPEAEKALESGDVNLTTVSSLNTFLRNEQRYRRPYTIAEKRELVKKIKGKNREETERVLHEISPMSVRRDHQRVISATEQRISFTATQNLMAQLARFRGLVAHKNPNPSFCELFSMLVEIALKQVDPEKKVTRRKTRQDKDKIEKRENSRRIPEKLRTMVWERDRGRCQFMNPKTKRTCYSQHKLQIDHIKPFALGGKTEFSNLRLLCAAHNLLAASDQFGKDKTYFRRTPR